MRRNAGLYINSWYTYGAPREPTCRAIRDRSQDWYRDVRRVADTAAGHIGHNLIHSSLHNLCGAQMRQPPPHGMRADTRWTTHSSKAVLTDKRQTPHVSLRVHIQGWGDRSLGLGLLREIQTLSMRFQHVYWIMRHHNITHQALSNAPMSLCRSVNTYIHTSD